jgi:hypothetical protein
MYGDHRVQQHRDRDRRIDPFVAVGDEVHADRRPCDRAVLLDPEGHVEHGREHEHIGPAPAPMATRRSPMYTIRRV